MAQDWLDVSSTTPRITYTVGATPQSVFVVPFIFFADADLVVAIDGVAKLLGVHYAVAGAGSETGGSVTFLTPQSNCKVSIVRDIAIALDTHIPTFGPLDIGSVNLQFSRLIAIMQEHSARSIQLPDTEGATLQVLAPIQARKNRLLGFGTGGELIYPTGPSFVGDTAINVAAVDSLATAQVTSFPGSVNIVRTSGYSSPGRGAASYLAVDSEPSHPGKFQDKNGRWFQIAEPVLTPEMFGALPGASDSLTALLAMFFVQDVLGLASNLLSEIWTISNTLSYTWSSKPRIYGNGAVIKLDRGSGAGVQHGVLLTVGSFGADVRGWRVDGSDKCTIPVAIVGTDNMASLGDLYAEDIGGMNSFRDDTTRRGAYGFWVYRGFAKVTLVRPYVNNVRVAAGQIVPSIQGAHGLVIEPSTTGWSKWVDIFDPRVSNVFCLDINVANDQDGISIFGRPPIPDTRRDEYVRIHGGECRNCRGRSIKIARQNGRVAGTHFARDGSDGYTGRGLMEIDFQYGEGVVRDVTYRHANQTVERILSSSYQSDMVAGPFDVDGVRGYVDTAMAASMDCIIAVSYTSGFNAPIKSNIRNIDHSGKYVNQIVEIGTAYDSAGEHWTIEDNRVSSLAGGLIKVVSGTPRISASRNIHMGITPVPVIDPNGFAALWDGSRNQGFLPRSFTTPLIGLTAVLNVPIVASRGGDTVTLSFDATTGTSNTSSMELYNLPADLLPDADRSLLFRVVDGGVAKIGVAVVKTNGQIWFYTDVALGGWASSGSKGFAAQTITYNIR